MARPLKVGVQLPEVEYVVRWPQLREMAVTAEEVGFDSLWVGDHLLYRRPLDVVGPWEAWSTLAALAAVTSKVELGPLVACTSFHNPAMLAKKAATVDEISNGRLILGLGAGWNEPDYTGYGFPYDKRASRFEEAFTIIRTLLREGHIDFDGQFYQARDCELVPRGPTTQRPAAHARLDRRAAAQLHRAVHRLVERVARLVRQPAGGSGGLTRRGRRGGYGRRSRSTRRGADRDRARAPARRHGPRGRRRDRQADSATDRHVEEMAQTIGAYADVGVAHVQLVLDPITTASIEEVAPVLEILDRA